MGNFLRNYNAFNCPHTDKPSASLGRCAYCYYLHRRGYSLEKVARLIKQHDERETCHALGIFPRSKEYSQWRRYGLIPSEVHRRLQQQDYRCEACGNQFELKVRTHRSPEIDHDHGCCEGLPTCGRCTRGIICGRCNIVLGLLEPEPRLLPTYLREYLERHQLRTASLDEPAIEAVA